MAGWRSVRERRDRADRQCGQKPESWPGYREPVARQQGADEIAQEVSRGDEPRVGFAPAESPHHRREDRRVDKAADPDRGGDRRQSAECQCQGAIALHDDFTAASCLRQR